MRERDKRGKLVGTVTTDTVHNLSPLRCAVQPASHRVTWGNGNGTMKLRTRTHAVRQVEPNKSSDPAFYWRPKHKRSRYLKPYLVKGGAQ